MGKTATGWYNTSLRDGGALVLEDRFIDRWQKIYKNVDVRSVIGEMAENQAFIKSSYRGALKLINKTLKERNNLKL